MNGLSLGIPGVGVVKPGTHFCALYSGPAQRYRLLYPFIEEGLRQGDKCMCLIDDVEPALVRDRAVGQPGPDYSRRSAQLDVERSSDAYLRSGEFSVEDMVSLSWLTAPWCRPASSAPPSASPARRPRSPRPTGTTWWGWPTGAT